MKAFQTPARAARRKLLTDRFTELLTEWGSPHAGERAAQLLAAVDDLGFTLPAPLEDVPPPVGSGADPDHRAQCMAEIRGVFQRDRRPAYGGSA